MKHNNYRRFILSFGTLLLFAHCGFAQIQGGVFDQRGQGIANAVIIATDTLGKVIDTVRSDKRGFYAFRVLKPGKYKIEAKAAGFSSAVYENVEVIEEESVENIGRNDESSATRLEIVLKPTKVPR